VIGPFVYVSFYTGDGGLLSVSFIQPQLNMQTAQNAITQKQNLNRPNHIICQF